MQDRSLWLQRMAPSVRLLVQRPILLLAPAAAAH
jgi:hypothetical protein